MVGDGDDGVWGRMGWVQISIPMQLTIVYPAKNNAG